MTAQTINVNRKETPNKRLQQDEWYYS